MSSHEIGQRASRWGAEVSERPERRSIVVTMRGPTFVVQQEFSYERLVRMPRGFFEDRMLQLRRELAERELASEIGRDRARRLFEERLFRPRVDPELVLDPTGGSEIGRDREERLFRLPAPRPRVDPEPGPRKIRRVRAERKEKV